MSTNCSEKLYYDYLAALWSFAMLGFPLPAFDRAPPPGRSERVGFLLTSGQLPAPWLSPLRPTHKYSSTSQFRDNGPHLWSCRRNHSTSKPWDDRMKPVTFFNKIYFLNWKWTEAIPVVYLCVYVHLIAVQQRAGGRGAESEGAVEDAQAQCVCQALPSPLRALQGLAERPLCVWPQGAQVSYMTKHRKVSP